MLQTRPLAAMILLASAVLCGPTRAHPFHSHTAPSDSDGEAQQGNRGHGDESSPTTVSLRGPSAEAFAPFGERVKTKVLGTHLLVESDGLPEHGMMIGIRAWQQQVPLPQPFAGTNAWRLPRSPRPSDRPISVLTEPLRGAIALAVNGVPIFCALNNRGEDTFLAGELDQWGGHCGRGDDYHYHIAPIHLEKRVGVGNPIAFALDGYAILGLTEADGSTPADLDRFNGHEHDGNYHYHATKGFPYVNGGLHGVVTMQGDQIQQPRDSPVRPGMPPLRGAKITSFERSGNDFDLRYDVSGREGRIQYSLKGNNRVEFKYQDTSGDSRTETYQRGGGGADQRRPGQRRRRAFSFYGWPITFGVLATIGVVVMIRRRTSKEAVATDCCS